MMIRKGMLLLMIGVGAHFYRVSAYEVCSPIPAKIAANPIGVVYWVLPGVTPANEANSLANIWKAFQLWEAVPTSGLRFFAADTLHDATAPTIAKDKLVVIVGNAKDLKSGGSWFPSADGPGSWQGAVADGGVDLTAVGVHEIGHCIGFGHSSIGSLFPHDKLPVMHWALASPVPIQDDIAAISMAYPDSVHSIRKECACITGRMVSTGALPVPVPGMNVVAVDPAGNPVVGRLSLMSGNQIGRFDICGLPAGAYDIRFLDGRSYHGLMDVAGGVWVRQNAQVDNAPEPPRIRRTVAAGDSIDLGDIPVAIEPIRADSLVKDSVTTGIHSRFTALTASGPPPAPLGAKYVVWLHLRGGIRGLQISDKTNAVPGNPPPGLAFKIETDSRTTADAVNGNAFLSIMGTPTREGTYAIRIPIVDKRNIVDTVAFTLTVGTNVSILGRSAVTRMGKPKSDGIDALGRKPSVQAARARAGAAVPFTQAR